MLWRVTQLVGVFIGLLIIGLACLRESDPHSNLFRPSPELKPPPGGGASNAENERLNDQQCLEYCRKLLGKEHITGTEIRLLYRQKKISKDQFVRSLMRLLIESPDIESRWEIVESIPDSPAFIKWYESMLKLALDAPSSTVEQKIQLLERVQQPVARLKYVEKLTGIILANKSANAAIDWLTSLSGDERTAAFSQITGTIATDQGLTLPESIGFDKLTDSEASELMESLATKAGQSGVQIATDWLMKNGVVDGRSWSFAFASMPSPSFDDADTMLENFSSDTNRERLLDGISRKLVETHGIQATISWINKSNLDLSSKNQIVRSSGLQGGGALDLDDVVNLIDGLSDKSSINVLLETIIESKSSTNSTKDLDMAAKLRTMLSK